MRKIKVGDIVKVIAGSAKGTTGKVLSVRDDRVVVDGVNQKTKATKGEGHTTFFAPIHISNVMYYDEASQKAVRIHRVVDGKSRKRTFAGASASFI